MWAIARSISVIPQFSPPFYLMTISWNGHEKDRQRHTRSYHTHKPFLGISVSQDSSVEMRPLVTKGGGEWPIDWVNLFCGRNGFVDLSSSQGHDISWMGRRRTWEGPGVSFWTAAAQSIEFHALLRLIWSPEAWSSNGEKNETHCLNGRIVVEETHHSLLGRFIENEKCPVPSFTFLSSWLEPLCDRPNSLPPSPLWR